MPRKNSVHRSNSLTLIFVLLFILTSCIPQKALVGTGGMDATEPPIATEPPLATEPPVESLPVDIPTDTPVATDTLTSTPVDIIIDAATPTSTATEVALNPENTATSTATETSIVTETPSVTPTIREAMAAAANTQNIILTGSCDGGGNSVFTIKNTGGAMTVNYSWEIYQNSAYLTNGAFMLTAAGTTGDTLQLTINGLYGNISVGIKDGVSSGTAQIAFTTALCVTPTPTKTRTPTPTLIPPNVTVMGSCDGGGNSVFTIKNTGGAMTVNYTWEIYQNSAYLTNGAFMLTAAGTTGDTLQLTINGLYGNISVAVKNGTTPSAVQVASSTALCVTPTPSITRTPTITHTPSITPTPSKTSTTTITPTPSKTLTATITPTASATSTSTPTVTATSTEDPTSTATLTPTPSTTSTLTPTFTNTSTATATKTNTRTPGPVVSIKTSTSAPDYTNNTFTSTPSATSTAVSGFLVITSIPMDDSIQDDPIIADSPTSSITPTATVSVTVTYGRARGLGSFYLWTFCGAGLLIAAIVAFLIIDRQRKASNST